MVQEQPNRTGACALYARVSSESQDVDLSISAQLKALRRYATQRGWRVVKEYIDEAKSARTDKRPAFKEMIADALQGRFSKILVWKFSRFARNRKDSIIYKSLLRKHGVDVVSINEPVDDTPEGRLLEGMIEVIDQFYSDTMAGDIRRGMREAIERGFYVGRTLPFGYTTTEVPDGPKTRKKLVPDETQAPVVQAIFSRYSSGEPVTAILTDLNRRRVKTSRGKTWDKNGIYRVLRNPLYIGVYVSRGQVLNDHYCPPLVGRTVFERVQHMLDSRTPTRGTAPRAAASDYLLAGLLRCALCGRAYVGEKATGRGGTYRYYLCSGRSKRRTCSAPRIPKEIIEQAVVARLVRHVLSRQNITRLVELVNSSLVESAQALREELRVTNLRRLAAETALNNLYSHAEKSFEASQALISRIRERQKEVEFLEAQVASIREALEKIESRTLPTKRTIARAVTQLRKELLTDDFLGQKAFIQRLVQRIEINSCTGETKVFYTFPIPKLQTYWEEIQLHRSLLGKAGSASKKLVELTRPIPNSLVLVFWLPGCRPSSRIRKRNRTPP